MHKIHIVENSFPIDQDGILGRDFFEKFLCKIDYEAFVLNICVASNEISIPINTSSEIRIPARCEIIRSIDLTVTEDSVILNHEIQNGIFLASSLISPGGVGHIRLLNTRDHDVSIKSLTPQTIPLKHFEILSLKCNSTPSKSFLNERYKHLLKELNVKNLEHDESALFSILEICKNFADIFHLNGEQLSVNNFYKEKLLTTDKQPTYIKNYRLPQSQLQEIKDQVKDLIKDKIVEPSVSSFNSPLLIVPKKSTNGDSKYRLVVDYRQLNKKLLDDRFPLPRLEDILDKLGKAKYFSTIDLKNSFHQIELEESSRPLTAFSTNDGQFQFRRLPFGCKISTNSFQRMLTIALSGLGSQAFLYVDDVIIFGCSLKHHNNNLIQVFERMRKYNLKLNPQKCNFLQPEVTYLGHLFTSNGIKTDPSKYLVVKNYPTPKNADETRRFVAFCNYYRRFIQNFAFIAKPLNNLLKKGMEFEWSNDCNNAFQTLKEKLINPPILQYPDFSKTFILTTDASNFALGAVLSQGELGQDLPICFASRALIKSELNKPIIEKELLAIYWGITYYRSYLYGRKFLVVTDHRPLISLFNHKNPSSKLTRIRTELSDYDFQIIFKPGKYNTNADALSRIKIDSEILKNMIPTNHEEIKIVTRSMTKQNQPLDDSVIAKNEVPDQLFAWQCISISEVRKIKILSFSHENKKSKNLPYIFQDNNEIQVVFNTIPCLNLPYIFDSLVTKMSELGIEQLSLKTTDYIFNFVSISKFKSKFNEFQKRNENPRLRIVIFNPPINISCESTQNSIIRENHDSPCGGHNGIKRTINRIKQRYSWKNMRQMVINYISKCKICQINKQHRHIREKSTITDTPSSSFETIIIDTVGPLKISNGYRYILTIQCDLTKYVVAIPLENKESLSIAKSLVNNFILIYGMFKKVKSDRGSEFLNEVFTNITKLLKIEHITSTSFHHETLGTVERNHRILNEYLLCFTDDYNWDEWIPYFLFAYNTTPHSDTGYSPFELVFGKIANLPYDFKSVVNEPIYNIDNYASELKYRLSIAYNKAHELLKLAKNKRKKILDKLSNPINVNKGDQVFLRKGNRRKFQSPYDGPYLVVNDNNKNNPNCKIQIDNKIKEVHKNRLKKCKQ